MTTEETSYKEHDSQYNITKLEEIKQLYNKKTLDKDEFLPDQPLGNLLETHCVNIKTAIDLGSGVGWTSQLLSKHFNKVYAIEPSSAAQNLAKQMCENITNIEYMCGFAEEKLGNLIINEPVLFTTSCVLSHLSDNTVASICKKINELAVEDSIISFSENWSEHGSVQEELWYSRPKDWWRNQFPNWDITFNTTYPSNRPGMYKGFWGIKHKSFDAMKDEDFWNETC